MEQGVLKSSDIHGDLGEVVAGAVAGRNEDENWTLFLSGGTGIEDVAVATAVFERALEEGIGTEFEFNRPYEFEL
jgi:alanine dehydrogenase